MEPETDPSDSSPVLPLRPAINFSRHSARPISLPPPQAPAPVLTLPRYPTKRLSTTMLRITPVPIPSFPTINKKVQSLLADAKVSHYNYQMTSYRIPHKYDHFHDKTYEINFVPTFNLARFQRKPGAVQVDPTQSLTRALYRIKAQQAPQPLKKHHRSTRSSHSPPLPSQKSPLPTHTPFSVSRSQSPRPVQSSHVLPVVCVQDGSDLNSPGLRSVVMDLKRYFDKYVGFALHKETEEEHTESLATHGLMEVLEAGTKALRPEAAFTALYSVDGVRIQGISDIPTGCQALVFGWERFLGLL